MTQEKTAERDALIVDAVRGIIAENYSDPDLDLPTLIDRLIVGVQRRTIQRALAPHGGWRSMLRQYRMDVAARLMLETDPSNAAVASRVGYRQATQFAKAFRQVHGTTPFRYRDRELAKQARAAKRAAREAAAA